MIFRQLVYQLNALSEVLEKLTDEHYTAKIRHLRDASVGGHTRHILELLQCLIKGYYEGEVDYVNRTRNLSLESDRTAAIKWLTVLLTEINLPDKKLVLATEEAHAGENQTVYTTYFREIVYQTEHTVHHLALIQVSLIELQLNIAPLDFGLAYSTIKFKNAVKENQLQN